MRFDSSPVSRSPVSRSPVSRRLASALFAALLLAVAAPSWAAQGWNQARSPRDVPQTMQRLEAAVKDKGLNVFARINHSAAAAKVGMELRPTELLIFGNPKAGTVLMQCSQTAGIDLPLKMLVWQDAQGQTWVGYTAPQTIAQRHDAADCAVVPTMDKLMHALQEQAVAQ